MGEIGLEAGHSKSMQLCNQSPERAAGGRVSLIKLPTKLEEYAKFPIHQF